MLRPEPLLFRQTAFVKFIVLVLIILVSWLLTFFLAVLLSPLLFDVPVLEALSGIGLPDTTGEISLLKFMQLMSQVGAFILPSFLFALLVSVHVGDYLGLKRAPAIFSSVAVVLVMYLLLPLINELMAINQAMKLPDSLHFVEQWMRATETRAEELTKLFLATSSVKDMLVNVFIVGVIAAIAEELLFRAVLIRLFRNWLRNVHLAVIISSLIFSAFHFQFYGFLPRFVLGLIFGYLFVWSGTVWLPVIAHFVNNASAVLVYYLAEQGVIEKSVDEFGRVENVSLLIISIVLSIAMLFFIYMNERSGLNFLRRDRHS